MPHDKAFPADANLLAPLLDASVDGLLAFDREFRYTAWNLQMERISGLRREQVLGRAAFEVFPFLLKTGEDFYFREALAGRDAVSRRRPYDIPESNRRGFFDGHYSPLRDASGEIVGAAGVVRDVTERERVDERYRAFIANSSEGIWRFELEEPVPAALPADEQIEIFYARGYLAECNDAMARMYGFARAEEIVGARLADLLIRSEPDNIEYLRAFVNSGYRLNDVESIERDREGNVKHFSNSLVGVIEGGSLRRAWGTQRDVTDRRLGEEALARYRLLSKLSRDIMLFVRPADGRIIEANEAAVAAYGYSREELAGKTVKDLREPRTLPLLAGQLRQADADGILFETLHRRRNGSTFPVEVSATGAEVAGERLVMSVVRDITERKRADEELRRSQQLFAGVAEAIPDVLYLYDLAEHRVTYTNREVWNVLGYTPERVAELGSRLFETLMHPDDLARVPEHLARLASLGDGDVAEFEFRIRHADGGYRWLLSRDVAFSRGPDARVRTTCGVTQDVTVRRLGRRLIEGQNRVLEMLTAGEPLEQLLEEIVRVVEEQNGDMLCSVLLADEDGRALRLGAAPSLAPEYFRHAEGLSVGPAHGSCGTAVHRRETVVVEDIATDPLWASHRDLALAHDLRACWSTPVLSSAGRALATFGVYYRVPRGPRPEEKRLVEAAAHLVGVATERRHAERERDLLLESESAARVEAERANRLKDEFLATLSHELRTPLTSILGWAKMLKGGALDAETGRRAVEVIMRNAEAQKQIVEDVLDASRIITGKLRIEPEEVVLLDVVREVLDAVRPAADAKGVELICNFDPQVGPIVGDPHRLRQVVWNLLSNAVKFTDRGGSVQVEAGRSLSSVRLSVSDTGAGIAPDFLPHVFERFRQADGSTTRLHGGLGLGLSIVRHLVEAHGGSVHAYSAGTGQGASFTVELPLPAGSAAKHPVDETARQVSGETNAPIPAGTSGEVPPVLFGVRLLLVEDDPDTLELMKVFLRRHGAEVSAATSAQDALELLADAKPDVIISDIGMAGTDGYELMRRVRALRPEAGGLVPAVALTAYATDADRLAAARAGYQTHLAKPVEPAALLRVLTDLIAASRPDVHT